jgi:hypothetical protein
MDGEPACRRDSVRPAPCPDERQKAGVAIHLSGLPGKRPLLRDRTSSASSTLGRAPGGVYRAGGVAPVAGARSLCTVLRVTSTGFASTLLRGVPTFLDTILAPVRAQPVSDMGVAGTYVLEQPVTSPGGRSDVRSTRIRLVACGEIWEGPSKG